MASHVGPVEWKVGTCFLAEPEVEYLCWLTRHHGDPMFFLNLGSPDVSAKHEPLVWRTRLSFGE